jgi:hypothetical protein
LNCGPIVLSWYSFFWTLVKEKKLITIILLNLIILIYNKKSTCGLGGQKYRRLVWTFPLSCIWHCLDILNSFFFIWNLEYTVSFKRQHKIDKIVYTLVKLYKKCSKYQISIQYKFTIFLCMYVYICMTRQIVSIYKIWTRSKQKIKTETLLK